MTPILKTRERRKWPRLQLAIPVFVRTREGNGKESLEFATAMNVSAGGALVLVRKALPKSSAVSLEIPSAPFSHPPGPDRLGRALERLSPARYEVLPPAAHRSPDAVRFAAFEES